MTIPLELDDAAKIDVAWLWTLGQTRRKSERTFHNVIRLMGVPMLEEIIGMPLEHDHDHLGLVKKLLSEVPVGITHFILHPSIDTPELRAICPDWQARVANYNAFMSDDLKKFIEQEDIKLIGYRQVRDAMRNG